jgi:urease accessory protein
VWAAALPSLAQAHPGSDAGLHHGLGFVSGFVHPFSGADHLCAMMAVGLWSALSFRGWRMWLAPLAFALTLAAGAACAMAGLRVPLVEPMIAASVLVLGLLLAANRHLPAMSAALLCMAFAWFHGAAHGAALAASPSPAAALAGMALGTATLHVIGLGLGGILRDRGSWWTRVPGTALAALGTVLLWQAT